MNAILELCPKQHRLDEPLDPRSEHGETWRQVDKVVGYDPETRTVYATRTFTGEEVIKNEDHLEGWVIMAGALQQEFGCQAAIQYALFDHQYDGCLFTIIKIEATFRQPVAANTELMAICQLLKLPKPGTINLGEAACQLKTADGAVVMTAKIVFKAVLKSRTPLAGPQTATTEEG